MTFLLEMSYTTLLCTIHNNDVYYYTNACKIKYNGLPAMGGPTSEATPWNINSIPKAFVNLSRPSKSTRITDVKPTYAPIVDPKTIVYNDNESRFVQYVLSIVAAPRKKKLYHYNIIETL